jgi:hypothetical protein
LRESFDRLLAEGEAKFGPAVAEAKRAHVVATITQILARFPGVRLADPKLGLIVYPISRTPFAILYDFDDMELRVHFIFMAAQDPSMTDAGAVEW